MVKSHLRTHEHADLPMPFKISRRKYKQTLMHEGVRLPTPIHALDSLQIQLNSTQFNGIQHHLIDIGESELKLWDFPESTVSRTNE